MEEHGARIDPYRIFFPLGGVAAILGTVLWIAFGFGWIGYYPGISHADLMTGGFLFAFVMGFLMTAIPQFTGAHRASGAERAIGALLLLSLFVIAFLEPGFPFHAV